MFNSRETFESNLYTILKTEAPDDIIDAAIIVMRLLEGEPDIYLAAEDPNRIWTSDEPIASLYFYIRGVSTKRMPCDLTIRKSKGTITYSVQGSLTGSDTLLNRPVTDPVELVEALRLMSIPDHPTYSHHQRSLLSV